MSALPQRLLSISAAPLGAHWDGEGCHFAVYSEHAEAIELCLFGEDGQHEQARLPLPECSHGVWRGYLPGAGPGLRYGYRACGPYRPEQGHRFNPYKLLVDPYARAFSGELCWHDALYGYRIGSPRADLSYDRRDSAPYMPRSVIVDPHFDWGDDRPPRTPWRDTVIYEMHLRGFSRRREDIPQHQRGGFAALGHPKSIDYLRHLGVTAVELMPVHAFIHDRHLTDVGLSNYWGYNTLGWFAPHQAYVADGGPAEMKRAIRQLHAAGIEVILDVVYNHSCEGNQLGPTLSLRGLDNATYYRQEAGEPRYPVNDTGCGNTLDFSQPRVIQLVMDSLRYWVGEFHVDGFRFDLGATLGREAHGFDPGSGFFDALMQDPILAEVKLIFEPWDVGPGGYQLGNHPPGSAEWNDRFRDDVRAFWRGDHGLRGALADRLQGSADFFDRRGRAPWASINFVTAHDGFTLEDLVSYERKRNDENGEQGQDGADDNLGSGWGADGPTEDPGINSLRHRIKRNLLATTLLAHGTPMLLAGDEFGQTQHGNNNAYCQDNETAWLDWSRLDRPAGRNMHAFVRELIALRKRLGLLRADRFLHGAEISNGLRDVAWFDESGAALIAEDWDNENAKRLMVRRAATDADGGIEILLLLLNAAAEACTFHWPGPMSRLQVLVDTAEPARMGSMLDGDCYELPGHSLALIGGPPAETR